MSNWLDRFKPQQKKNNNNNPLSGLFQGSKYFAGEGQSLGGTQPGKVFSVTLSEPGTLGIKLEKRTGGTAKNTAIIGSVTEGSQAQAAGLQRGDVLCFAGSDGTEEIMYDMFLELAKSEQRPLCFEARRVPQTKNVRETKSSADDFAKRQAVIAAAEKRNQEHMRKQKPIPKTGTDRTKLLSTVDRQKLEQERQERLQQDKDKPLSAATQEALKRAKEAEEKTAAQLGYNPYEVKQMTSGQARTAVTATTYGAIQSEDAAAVAAPGKVSAPRPPTDAASDAPPPPASFQHAFETTVTSHVDHSAAVNSITIMRKLIINATTKDDAKFRKIRLTNAKIRDAITDVPGAVDLLLETGFQLHTDDDDENVLVYPETIKAPVWLPAALRQMEHYAQS